MRAKGIFISGLLAIDTFLISFALGFNSRHVLVVDPALPPLLVKSSKATKTPAGKVKAADGKDKTVSGNHKAHAGNHKTTGVKGHGHSNVDGGGDKSEHPGKSKKLSEHKAGD